MEEYIKDRCVECCIELDNAVSKYSKENFGFHLCMQHQNFINDMRYKSTPYSIDLYLALRERGIPAILEKFDGFKTIDIAIPSHKINIEVDGGHHVFESRQALADLKRTYHSFKKGYFTLRIPNALVANHLYETATYIVCFLNEYPR